MLLTAPKLKLANNGPGGKVALQNNSAFYTCRQIINTSYGGHKTNTQCINSPTKDPLKAVKTKIHQATFSILHPVQHNS